MMRFGQSPPHSKRALSALLIFFFIFNSIQPFILAEPSSSDFQLQDIAHLSLPPELGTVTERHLATSRSAVILIQDAHAVGGAQKSIRAITDYLSEKCGLSLFALEGASEKIDPFFFRSFPDQEKIREVFQKYLESGELSGAAAGSVLNKKEADYFGVEDQKLYEQGIDLFLESLETAREWEPKIKKYGTRIEGLKKKYYSPELLEFDKLTRSIQSNQKTFENLRLIQEKFDKQHLFLNYPHLAAILKEMSGAPSASALQGEIQTLAAALQLKMSRVEALAEFHKKQQAYRTEQLSTSGYAFYLAALADRYQIPVAAGLRREASQYSLLETLHGEILMEELERYLEEVRAGLFKTKKQRAIHAADQKRELLEKLVQLKLSRKEWEKFEPKAESQDLSLKNASFYQFYQNAAAREEAMRRNLAALMKKYKTDRAVLVAGGFHAQGLLQKFREEGVSYALITPRIASVDSESKYLDYMRGNVSWKKYFRAEKGRISLYEAFARAVRDQLLNASGVKLWRDEIIRKLADQRQVERAGRYTRFLDERARPSSSDVETIKKQWLARVEKFIADMRLLKKENHLDVDHLMAIAGPSSARIATAQFPSAAPLAENATIPDSWAAGKPSVHFRSEARGIASQPIKPSRRQRIYRQEYAANIADQWARRHKKYTPGWLHEKEDAEFVMGYSDAVVVAVFEELKKPKYQDKNPHLVLDWLAHAFLFPSEKEKAWVQLLADNPKLLKKALHAKQGDRWGQVRILINSEEGAALPSLMKKAGYGDEDFKIVFEEKTFRTFLVFNPMRFTRNMPQTEENLRGRHSELLEMQNVFEELAAEQPWLRTPYEFRSDSDETSASRSEARAELEGIVTNRSQWEDFAREIAQRPPREIKINGNAPIFLENMSRFADESRAAGMQILSRGVQPFQQGSVPDGSHRFSYALDSGVLRILHIPGHVFNDNGKLKTPLRETAWELLANIANGSTEALHLFQIDSYHLLLLKRLLKILRKKEKTGEVIDLPAQDDPLIKTYGIRPEVLGWEVPTGPKSFRGIIVGINRGVPAAPQPDGSAKAFTVIPPASLHQFLPPDLDERQMIRVSDAMLRAQSAVVRDNPAHGIFKVKSLAELLREGLPVGIPEPEQIQVILLEAVPSVEVVDVLSKAVKGEFIDGRDPVLRLQEIVEEMIPDGKLSAAARQTLTQALLEINAKSAYHYFKDAVGTAMGFFAVLMPESLEITRRWNPEAYRLLARFFHAPENQTLLAQGRRVLNDVKPLSALEISIEDGDRKVFWPIHPSEDHPDPQDGKVSVRMSDIGKLGLTEEPQRVFDWLLRVFYNTGHTNSSLRQRGYWSQRVPVLPGKVDPQGHKQHSLRLQALEFMKVEEAVSDQRRIKGPGYEEGRYEQLRLIQGILAETVYYLQNILELSLFLVLDDGQKIHLPYLETAALPDQEKIRQFFSELDTKGQRFRLAVAARAAEYDKRYLPKAREVLENVLRLWHLRDGNHPKREDLEPSLLSYYYNDVTHKLPILKKSLEDGVFSEGGLAVNRPVEDAYQTDSVLYQKLAEFLRTTAGLPLLLSMYNESRRLRFVIDSASLNLSHGDIRFPIMQKGDRLDFHLEGAIPQPEMDRLVSALEDGIRSEVRSKESEVSKEESPLPVFKNESRQLEQSIRRHEGNLAEVAVELAPRYKRSVDHMFVLRRIMHLEVNRIQGRVVAADSERRLLKIKRLQAAGIYDDTNLFVPENADLFGVSSLKQLKKSDVIHAEIKPNPQTSILEVKWLEKPVAAVTGAEWEDLPVLRERLVEEWKTKFPKPGDQELLKALKAYRGRNPYMRQFIAALNSAQDRYPQDDLQLLRRFFRFSITAPAPAPKRPNRQVVVFSGMKGEYLITFFTELGRPIDFLIADSWLAQMKGLGQRSYREPDLRRMNGYHDDDHEAENNGVAGLDSGTPKREGFLTQIARRLDKPGKTTHFEITEGEFLDSKRYVAAARAGDTVVFAVYLAGPLQDTVWAYRSTLTLKDNQPLASLKMLRDITLYNGQLSKELQQKAVGLIPEIAARMAEVLGTGEQQVFKAARVEWQTRIGSLLPKPAIKRRGRPLKRVLPAFARSEARPTSLEEAVVRADHPRMQSIIRILYAKGLATRMSHWGGSKRGIFPSDQTWIQLERLSEQNWQRLNNEGFIIREPSLPLEFDKRHPIIGFAREPDDTEPNITEVMKQWQKILDLIQSEEVLVPVQTFLPTDTAQVVEALAAGTALSRSEARLLIAEANRRFDRFVQDIEIEARKPKYIFLYGRRSSAASVEDTAQFYQQHPDYQSQQAKAVQELSAQTAQRAEKYLQANPQGNLHYESVLSLESADGAARQSLLVYLKALSQAVQEMRVKFPHANVAANLRFLISASQRRDPEWKSFFEAAQHLGVAKLIERDHPNARWELTQFLWQHPKALIYSANPVSLRKEYLARIVDYSQIGIGASLPIMIKVTNGLAALPIVKASELKEATLRLAPSGTIIPNPTGLGWAFTQKALEFAYSRYLETQA